MEEFEASLKDFFSKLKESDFEEAKCIFCSNENIIHLFKKDSMDVVRCKCGFIFNKTQPTSLTLDRFYKSEALKVWGNIKKTDSRQEVKYKSAISHIKTCGYKTVLDIGCGTGYFIRELKKYGIYALGLNTDSSEKEPTLIVGDAASACIRNESYEDFFKHDERMFDVISLWGVLEHVKDPRSLIKGAKQKLKDFGTIIICVPNCESTVVKTLWEKCFTFCPQHLWYFSFDSLERLLSQENLDITHVEFIEYEIDPIVKNSLGLDPYIRQIPDWMIEKINEEKEKISETDIAPYKITVFAK